MAYSTQNNRRSLRYKRKEQALRPALPRTVKVWVGCTERARSKRINAHGTLPFPFHFPFQVSNDCSSNHSVYILHIFSEIVNTFYITYWKYFTNCITMLKLYRKIEKNIEL